MYFCVVCFRSHTHARTHTQDLQGFRCCLLFIIIQNSPTELITWMFVCLGGFFSHIAIWPMFASANTAFFKNNFAFKRQLRWAMLEATENWGYKSPLSLFIKTDLLRAQVVAGQTANCWIVNRWGPKLYFLNTISFTNLTNIYWYVFGNHMFQPFMKTKKYSEHDPAIVNKISLPINNLNHLSIYLSVCLSVCL